MGGCEKQTANSVRLRSMRTAFGSPHILKNKNSGKLLYPAPACERLQAAKKGLVICMSKLRKKRMQFVITALVVPVILLIVFVVIPAADLFRMSFTNWDGYSKESDIVGFTNYISMLKNKDLWLSLKNNAVYFGIHFFMIAVELGFAVILTGRLRAAKFYKTMVFMPYIINGVAVSYAFSYFFSPINGAFDAVLGALNLEFLIRNWLSDPKIVNYVLSFVSVWRFSGYHVILFMAALQSIPQDVAEAAKVDGANAWQLFKYIQVPGIMLMVDFVLFDNIRGSLQVFDIPFVITAGGPGYASSTFTLYTIKTAFTYSNFGLASTMAVAIMIMIVFIYVIQNKIIHGLILRDRRK